MQLFKKIFLAATLLLAFTACQDDCKNVTCSSVGECIEGECDCNTGYEGDNCEREISEKFVGSYSATEECESGNSSYTCDIASLNASQFEITDFSWQKVTVLATVTANEDDGNKGFTFSTNVSGKLFAGSGSLSTEDDEITINYGITENNVTDSCSVVLSK